MKKKKMDVDELINKLFNILNDDDFPVKTTTEFSDELLETLKITKNCVSCKNVIGKDYFDEFYESTNIIENCLANLEKREYDTNGKLNEELFQISISLNKEILCKSCKGKEIEKLTDKCGNEEIAR